jgi:hypothetical protein
MEFYLYVKAMYTVQHLRALDLNDIIVGAATFLFDSVSAKKSLRLQLRLSVEQCCGAGVT